MNSFHEKVVFITGASSGIGKATALRLGKRGAKIGLLARNRDALEEVARQIHLEGGSALVLPTDVTVSEQVRHAVEATVSHFGKLDISIACAGLSLRAYFEGSTLEALERVMHVNFFGTLYATHYALPHVKQARGSLVALSSLTGKRGIPSYAVYGASKFAIEGLYDALRLELVSTGVHVGVVSPAFVETPLRVNVLGADGKPWPVPPAPPFRVWPVEKCVDRVVDLIEKRRRQALLPRFTGPLLVLDEILGRTIGDRLLKWKFPS